MIWLFAETQKEMWLLASDWLATTDLHYDDSMILRRLGLLLMYVNTQTQTTKQHLNETSRKKYFFITIKIEGNLTIKRHQKFKLSFL